MKIILIIEIVPVGTQVYRAQNKSTSSPKQGFKVKANDAMAVLWYTFIYLRF